MNHTENRMPRRGRRITLARVGAAAFCAQWLLCASAKAQDHGALQAAGLFEQSCVRFAGHADLLRSWIGTHHLPLVPTEQASPFSGGRPAQMYGASTADVKMALVSEDSGACQVVVDHQTAATVEDALVSILGKSGVTTSLATQRSQGISTQNLYKASLGSRHWLLSVTSHTHTDAPGTLPEIILLATDSAG